MSKNKKDRSEISYEKIIEGWIKMAKEEEDHINIKEPLLSMNFNMTFSMDSSNVYDELIAFPSNKLLAQIYETKSSFMHISLSQFDFDMVYLNPRTKTFSKNLPSERFLSNFSSIISF